MVAAAIAAATKKKETFFISPSCGESQDCTVCNPSCRTELRLHPTRSASWRMAGQGPSLGKAKRNNIAVICIKQKIVLRYPFSPIYPALNFVLFCYTNRMYYFYVLENQDCELYYGSTRNIEQRIFEHKHGRVSSTKGHIWKLVYYEAYKSEADARNREHQVKYHGQAKRWLKERIKNSLRQS
jgi:putative endonuclease